MSAKIFCPLKFFLTVYGESGEEKTKMKPKMDVYDFDDDDDSPLPWLDISMTDTMLDYTPISPMKQSETQDKNDLVESSEEEECDAEKNKDNVMETTMSVQEIAAMAGMR